ncbi:hypothetical protein [Endozoicomonas sp. ALB032]|uniref:hypothetical protein n=1 Tax=Endozoicomonas sp. ALB032 TaxID=3403082 RepID=UPI003BB63936
MTLVIPDFILVIPDFILVIPNFILVIPAKAGIHTDSPPEPYCPVPPWPCHPREGRDPPLALDSRLRGNDDLRARGRAVGVLRHPLYLWEDVNGCSSTRSLTCRPYQKRSPLKHLPSIWLRVGEAGQIKQSSTPAFSPSPERHSPVFSDSGWCCWDQEADPVVNGWYPGGGQRLICWTSLFPGTRFMASAWHSGSKPSSSRKSSKLLPIWGSLITTSFLFP